MSLRMLIRLGALAIGLLFFFPLLWGVAGLWPLLAGVCILVLIAGYLLLPSDHLPVSRWQIRYWMETRQANERLDGIMNFLARRAGHIVLEANSQGLFLEAPAAFDRYVQVQLEQALPEARVSRLDNNNNNSYLARKALHLCLDPLACDPLRWAAEGKGRQVRLHLLGGTRHILVAQAADGSLPPGPWVRVSVPDLLAARLWRRLVVWDELSTGARLSYLLPTTGGDSVCSSRSRLLHLKINDPADGSSLNLSYAMPLFTAGAPSSFLVEQVLNDLQSGRSVVVISPYRRILNRIRQQAQTDVYWIDPENSRASAHLAVVDVADWRGLDVEMVVKLVEAFLVDLGLNLHLPALWTIVRHLVHILAASALSTGHDFAFTDLYAISQNTQILRAFLDDLANLGHRPDPGLQDSMTYLTGQLDGDASYVQVVTVLSVMRTVLSPLRSGVLHALSQPPFLDVGQALQLPGLFLVPVTNSDFPEHDRFLAAMLDLVLKRVLAARRADLKVTLHLHDPHRYYSDAGRRWIDVARQDDRVSLLIDVQDPDQYNLWDGGGGIIFRCSDRLASALIDERKLDYTAAELTELPEGMALACLPGLPGLVMLKAGNGR